MWSLTRPFLFLANNFGRKTLNIRCTVARPLYSSSSLGIDNYVAAREKTKTQFSDIEEKFKTKMSSYTSPDETTTIFTEDLKNMIHLAEQNDLGMVKEMIRKFAKQNKDMRFGSFIFGPVIMRMFYYLKKPEEALEMFKDQDLNGFFDQLVTYQILMDLLLENGYYNEVLDVFDMVRAKQIQGSKFPKNAVVLVLAACYKINSQKSLEYMKNLWMDLNRFGHYPMRRAVTFAAALAINHNAPHVALEILTTVKQQSYVTIRNLKVAALADLGRPDDTLAILRSVLEVDDNNDTKHTFSEEIINKVAAATAKLNNEEVTKEFEKMVHQMKALQLITSQSLEEQLFTEIVSIRTNLRQDQQNFPGSNYSNSWQNYGNPRQSQGYSRQSQGNLRQNYRRPGLEDLV